MSISPGGRNTKFYQLMDQVKNESVAQNPSDGKDTIIRSTSLSTVIGDNISKYSQPKFPIYRLGYILTYEDPFVDDGSFDDDRKINILMKNILVEEVPDDKQTLKQMDEKKYGELIKLMLKRSKINKSLLEFILKNINNYDSTSSENPSKLTFGDNGMTNRIDPWSERAYTFISVKQLA